MRFSSKVILTFTTISLFLSSCSAAEKQLAQTNPFGYDADYFMGLKLLADDKVNEAKLKFNNCIENGSYFCAKRSAQCLTTLGSVQDKNKACQKLIDIFPDEDSFLIAARQFTQSNELTRLIEITNNLNLTEADNELIRLRLEALNKTESQRYQQEVFDWFISRKISNEHYKFFRDTYFPSLPEEEADYTKKQYIICYRMDLYKKDYTAALEKSLSLFNLFEKADIEPYSLLVSDIGKAYLYASSDFKANAQLFEKLADEYCYYDSCFYFWFYAGRFWEKAGNHYTQAINCLENAIANTKSGDLKDNAMWYLLNTKISQSHKKAIEELNVYSAQWSDPEYFDDLFDSLIPQLMVSGNWSLFKTLFENIDGYASNETTAKVAYIYGRLIQEGYIKVKDKDLEIERAFTRALDCGINPYYKILSAYRLGYSGDEFTRVLCSSPAPSDKQRVESAEILLKGYVYFGFPEKVYPEWLELFKLGISTDTSMQMAQFLSVCAKYDSDYYPLSLRIAARSANISDRSLTTEELKFVYPQDYSEIIDTYSSKYNLDNSIMYALVRSESFFDEDVRSTAGAVGLTQLMELTAEDIAGKLKKREYNLIDPETNVEFGTYYLSELIRRCDNSILQAFFSYNAGITRVRRWLNSSMIEFGKKKHMPGDLFLETIPYSETREYGRKLISASLYYEWLYPKKDSPEKPRSFEEIVETFLY